MICMHFWHLFALYHSANQQTQYQCKPYLNFILQMSDYTPLLGMSHTVHKEIGIFEMMMSLFYHPRNSHCIFIDQKADTKVFQAVEGIVKCYREIFLQVAFSITSVIPHLCISTSKKVHCRPFAGWNSLFLCFCIFSIKNIKKHARKENDVGLGAYRECIPKPKIWFMGY